MSEKNISFEAIKSYKKDFEYSYTLGAFPTVELIKNKPEKIRNIYLHSHYKGDCDIEKLCRERHIPVVHDDKVFNRISQKENCFVAGVVKKYSCELMGDKNHVVLGNPSDMGNMGTIIRTMVGFGIYDLAIIAPCADIFNPKTLRASMGAAFRIRFRVFNSFEEYDKEYGNHDYFPFMLDGDRSLTIESCPHSELFSLIFGNEASGLPDSFKNVGQSIFIPQSPDVDSLNLTIAAGIGIYTFTRCMK